MARLVSLPVSADRDDLAPDGRGAQGVEHPVCDLLADIHERERISDLDGTDVTARDSRLVRDGAHDVTRPQPGPPASADPQPRPATGARPPGTLSTACATR